MDYTRKRGSEKGDFTTWQEFLNVLTDEASKNGLLNQILQIKKQSESVIAETCLSNEKLRNHLVKWMESTLNSEDLKKSAAKSTNFRLKGNEEFKIHHDEASLSLYTDGIRFAPPASQELALSFANRSAVLFHMHRYEDCARDAERALSLSYPENLHFKILLRLARCYLLLQKWDRCKETLDLADQNILNSGSNLPEVKTREVRRELESLNLELVQRTDSLPTCAPYKDKFCVELPSLLSGLNACFPHASAALELRYSPDKGRYVVTNQSVKQGDVLFIEKPYAYVVLPDQFKAHCHHCTQSMVSPVPCKDCTGVLYCSESCEEKSLGSYHQWECHGMSLMSAIGVAHLGLRLITATGAAAQLLQREFQSSKCQHFENSMDLYSSVYSLLPHIENMDAQDIFQYTATAMLLSLYLYHKTDYFANTAILEGGNISTLTQVCGIILRHITQLVCNAHAITKLDSPSGYIDSKITSDRVTLETQQRIATAIYPSASMMNHSCDPNINNSFFNEILIVKASRDIPKGEEVLNCYGPHFQRMGTAERQAALLAQYFFFCKCTACEASSGESFDPIQERLFALRCSSCDGPLIEDVPGREPAGSKTVQIDGANSHLMVCHSCGLVQPISSLVQDVFKAHSLFRGGCEDMEAGHVQEALIKLESCRELQERSLYRSHKDLRATYDTLGKCYAMLGCYDKSIECLKLVLPAVEEQYGESSIEVAHELQKLSDVMLCNLLSLKETPSKNVLLDAKNVVKRAQAILNVQYGEWNQGWQDLKRKGEQLDILYELADGRNDSHDIQSDLKQKLNLLN